jgi:hypothetical protein
MPPTARVDMKDGTSSLRGDDSRTRPPSATPARDANERRSDGPNIGSATVAITVVMLATDCADKVDAPDVDSECHAQCHDEQRHDIRRHG